MIDPTALELLICPISGGPLTYNPHKETLESADAGVAFPIVDGIPHLALIGSDRKLKATLIGAAPESVVESSLDALWRGNPMPYGAGSGT